MMDELLKQCRAFYANNPAGGILHVVLDDGNVDDGAIHWTMEEARKEGDVEAYAICEQLLELREDKRYELHEQLIRGGTP